MDVILKKTGPMPVNTYVLKDNKSKEAIFIDVGGDFENIKKEANLQDFKIKYILNTHGHFDHVLGEIYVQKNYPQIPIYMHNDDLGHILNLKEEIKYFGDVQVDGELVLDNFIDENTKLYLGDYQIKIFHTPGHSAGSLSFYTDNKLFSGDTLFYRSIGRTDFYDGSFSSLVSSVKNKLFKLPDNTIVYPGHGSFTTIGDEKKFNNYLT